MFSTLSKTEIIILATSYLSSANALNLVQYKKICRLVKGSDECQSSEFSFLHMVTNGESARYNDQIFTCKKDFYFELFTTQSQLLTTLRKNSFKTIVEK